jgi:transcriptional regulator with XRE-family HTH domain
MLARARLEQKLSQAQLAERCQTDQAVISRIERGVVSPSLDTLSRLAKGLGLRPVLHFERTTDAPPSGERMPMSGVAAKAKVAQRRSRSPVRTPAPASKPARPKGAAAKQALGESDTSTKRKRPT